MLRPMSSLDLQLIHGPQSIDDGRIAAWWIDVDIPPRQRDEGRRADAGMYMHDMNYTIGKHASQ